VAALVSLGFRAPTRRAKAENTTKEVAGVITGVGTRTPDLRIMRPPPVFRKAPSDNILRLSPKPLAEHLPHDTRHSEPLDTDLAALVDAWPNVPDAVKRGILAMVEACR